MRHSSPNRSYCRWPSNRLERLMLKLSLLFLGSLLLSVLSVKFVVGAASGQSALIAPVLSPLTSEELALRYRPMPLNDEVAVPDQVKVCMEPAGERFDLLGKVSDQGNTYYLLGVYSDFVNNDPLATYDELVQVNEAVGCERLVGVNSTAQPMSAYMSEAAAQDLECQRYERYIFLLGSTDQLQQALERHIEAGLGWYLLSAQQLQALQQLGVQVLDSYQELTVDMFSSSTP